MIFYVYRRYRCNRKTHNIRKCISFHSFSTLVLNFILINNAFQNILEVNIRTICIHDNTKIIDSVYNIVSCKSPLLRSAFHVCVYVFYCLQNCFMYLIKVKLFYIQLLRFTYETFVSITTIVLKRSLYAISLQIICKYYVYVVVGIRKTELKWNWSAYYLELNAFIQQIKLFQTIHFYNKNMLINGVIFI